MTETHYLNREELLSLNEQAVYELGGNAGVQSPRAFEVVLDQPKQVVFGQEVYPTIWVKAASADDAQAHRPGSGGGVLRGMPDLQGPRLHPI